MLRFENVSKIYGSKKAVDNLNFEIHEGEFICLIGPSGCGKTTTMKMINRLNRPSEGKIYFKEKDIMEEDAVKLRRSIGYVIQQIGLFPHMTIRDNITLVPKLLKWSSEKRNQRAQELLGLVNMPPEYLDRYPYELSGGQQQRIGVLRALAAEPPLILMDEPFGALDPITRNVLQVEFKNLQQKLGKTIVFVTHDIDEALKLADRIFIMREGQMVQQGTPNEILLNPANEFVEDFIGKERLQEAKKSIQTVGQIMLNSPVTIQQDGQLSHAIKRMRKSRVDSLMVVDENNVLKGLLNVEDIEREFNLNKKVIRLMKTDVDSVFEDTLLRDAARQMSIKSLRFLPVVNRDYRLIGILTRTNLVDAIYESIWGNEEVEESI